MLGRSHCWVSDPGLSSTGIKGLPAGFGSTKLNKDTVYVNKEVINRKSGGLDEVTENTVGPPDWFHKGHPKYTVCPIPHVVPTFYWQFKKK